MTFKVNNKDIKISKLEAYSKLLFIALNAMLLNSLQTFGHTMAMQSTRDKNCDLFHQNRAVLERRETASYKTQQIQNNDQQLDENMKKISNNQ